MDPTASVIGIASAAWNIIQYFQAVKKGGRERQDLEDEVFLTYQQFHALEIQFSDEEFSDHEAYIRPFHTMIGPNGAIPQLKSTLEEIKAELSKASKNKIASHFLWPFRKEDATVLITRLHRLTTKVHTALSQVQLEQGRIANLNISEIQEAVSTEHLRNLIEWISPLDFISMKDTPAKMALSGTGRWFLDGDEFKIFSSGKGEVLWCPGIPGAGKTCLALSAFEELVATKNEKIAVLIAFCAFDVPKTHSAIDILWSLLRQVVKVKKECSARVEKLYLDHVKGQQAKSRPGMEELCQILGEELKAFETTFLILDGLDEMPDHGQRVDLLQRLQALNPRPKLMATSRPDIQEWFTHEADNDGYRVPQESRQTWCDVCETDLKSHYTCAVGCNYDLCHSCHVVKTISVCELCEGSDFEVVYLATIDISARPEDIEQYVNYRIDKSNALRKVVSRGKTLRNEIINRVKGEAQDMFLLARFNMDVLESETSPNGVRNALQRLPRGITETYNETFRRIDHQNSNGRVKRLITFVAYSNNLLSLEALNHAVAIKYTDTMIDEDDISLVEDLVPMCAGLVAVTSGKYVFLRLAHETIRKYITDSQVFPFCDGERQLALACLTYLQFSAFDKSPYDQLGDSYEERKARFPFLTYAALHWGTHAKNSGDDEVVRAKVLELLRSQPHIDNASEAMVLEDDQDNSWETRSDVNGIHLGAYFGLPQAISELIAHGADPDSQDCFGTTALMYAVSEEHSDVVAVLLHSGASVDTVCKRGSTALHRAARSGNVKVVQQLVASNKDIAINAPDAHHDDYTALMLAISVGSVDIVNLLLQREEIDVAAKTGPRGLNALLYATIYNQPEILERLIVAGKADVNSADRNGATSLILAATLGYRNVAEILLKYKANPNLCDHYGGPAILRAVDDGQVEIVRLFLGNNFDTSFKDFLGRNILHGAAVNNQALILRLLLERVKQTGKGARIEETDNKGETPIFDASRFDYDECVKVLLEFGARTDIQNNAGASPVWSAREMGATRVIPLLRERRNTEKAEQLENFHLPRRADTFGEGFKMSLHSAARLLDANAFKVFLDTYNSPKLIEALDPSSGETPLHVACRRDSLPIVNILLLAGSPLEIHSQWGFTPMHFAAQRNSLPVLRALILAGADVNSKDLLDRTPLNFVLYEDFCVESSFLLIEHGADFDPHSSDVLSLLHWSAELGNLAVTKILVERGVPKDFKDTWGLTPYQRAKQKGHVKVADLLRGSSSLSTDQLVITDESCAETLMETEVQEMVEALDQKDVGKPANQRNSTVATNESERVSKDIETPLQGSETVTSPYNQVVSGMGSRYGPLTTREVALLMFIAILIAKILYR